jgi:hypothetical protein
MTKITIYQVKTRSLDIGTRIESFNCKCTLFKDKRKALDFAYEQTCLYAKYNSQYTAPEYNDEGYYCDNEGNGYDWKAFECDVLCKELDLDNDKLFTVSFRDY